MRIGIIRTLLILGSIFASGCIGTSDSYQTAIGTPEDGNEAGKVVQSSSEKTKDVESATNVHVPVSVDKPDDEILDIAFEDIQINIQEDIVVRPFMFTDQVRELDGKRIRINGFMLGDLQTRGIKEFILLKNTECKFGEGGRADHLIRVIMNDGKTAVHRNDAISVEGVFTINLFNGPDGNTWSIYDLACDKISKFKPRR